MPWRWRRSSVSNFGRRKRRDLPRVTRARASPDVRVPGAGYIAVAEHVIGLMLSMTKKIALLDRMFHRDKRWPAEYYEGAVSVGSVLDKKVLGIVGFGFIGRELKSGRRSSRCSTTCAPSASDTTNAM